LAADGWVAQTYRVVETDKKGKPKDKGWACDLVPKSLIVAHYFATQESAIASKQSELEAIAVSITELEEEHGGEEGYLGALEKVNKAEVNSRLKEIKGDRDADEEMAVLRQWLKLGEDEASCKRAIKDMDAELDRVAYAKYASLTKAEVKTLVIDHKWLPSLGAAVRSELDRLSQTLTGRVRLLAERYATPLPMLEQDVADLSARVAAHLQKMGFR
jgi:type I restriction enzyme M protein